MMTALLLIDIQNDYFPGGRMELPGAVESGLQARRALSFFREKSLPVIHVQHISLRAGATFFLPDSDGIAFHENVKPLESEIVFRKHFPNSFRGTPLLQHLRDRQITRLVVSGMMTSMCVDATVRAAFDYGFENILLHDAMAAANQSFRGLEVPAEYVHCAFLSALDGIYGKAMSVRQYIEHVPA